MKRGLRRLKTYRKSFPATEIAIPGNGSAKSCDRDVGEGPPHEGRCACGEDLAAAIAAGVQLPRLTVYADALRDSDLRAAVNLGVGRVVAGSVQQIELLRSAVARRPQDVVIRMTDVNTPVWR